MTGRAHACRAGAGNITADATWLPLLKTPAHPEYPSTHAATAGASAQTMARWPFSPKCEHGSDLVHYEG